MPCGEEDNTKPLQAASLPGLNNKVGMYKEG